MNVFTNMTQGPARALINDVVDAEYLQTANAVASAVMGTINHYRFYHVLAYLIIVKQL